jgi:DNA/RNA-binding domain of Phe-tRNA-synthetase-like protein
VPITVENRVPRDDLALGLVRVEGVAIGPAPAALAEELGRLVALRVAPLPPAEEALRKASRDMLRNGRYKPTGRGKPASEYLMRAASQGDFPRLSGPVDANNLVSLLHCVPISVWDLDLAGTERFEFRLGAEEERYVFNPSGQELDLRDLVCGCGLVDGESRPMVTPIKDSLATKLVDGTTRLAGAIYYPLGCGRARLEQATAELLRWLEACGADAEGVMAICPPGETVAL